MRNPSARHQMVCAIVQRHPRSVVALADAVGVPLPEHDDVTLHAYHGSGVRNTDAGGHVFVLSDKAPTAERFRTEDTARRADLAFAASFHSGQDLKPLQEAELPLGARALPAALADFRADLPGTLGMLDELSGGDLTLANLYLRAIVEEVPTTMLGEVLQQDMFEKLRELESFREYEAKVRAEADAAAAVAADARVAEAQARAAKEAVEAQAREVVQDLQSYFMHKGDAPTLGALEAMNACTNVTIARYWLNRAYAGETSAEIFPDRDDTK